MVAATVATEAQFSIGRVLSRAFGVVGRNAATFLLLSVVAAIPNMVMTVYNARLVAPQGAKPNPAALFGHLGQFLVVSLVGFVLSYILQAALAHGTYADLSGKRASFGDCLKTGLRNCLPLALIAILAFIGEEIGFVLLAVPGLILLTAWSVLVPVRVVEDTSVLETFGRSASLTRGHRLAILGLLFILYLGAGVAGFSIAPLSGGGFVPRVDAATPILYFIASGALGVVFTVILGTAAASLYYELRSIKEGIGPEQLAAVFD